MPFQRELLGGKIFEDSQALIGAHAEETGNKPPDPDWVMYLAFETAGNFRCFTFREDGDLKGYCLWFLGANPKRVGELSAICDMVYVVPGCRAAGGVFLRWCVRRLKSEGVQTASVMMSDKVDFSGLLEALGFKKTGTIHELSLGSV